MPIAGRGATPSAFSPRLAAVSSVFASVVKTDSSKKVLAHTSASRLGRPLSPPGISRDFQDSPCWGIFRRGKIVEMGALDDCSSRVVKISYIVSWKHLCVVPLAFLSFKMISFIFKRKLWKMLLCRKFRNASSRKMSVLKKITEQRNCLVIVGVALHASLYFHEHN